MEKIDEYERLSVRLKGTKRIVEEIQRKLDAIWFELNDEEIAEFRRRKEARDPMQLGPVLANRYAWLGAKIHRERLAGHVSPEREEAVAKRMQSLLECMTQDERHEAEKLLLAEKDAPDGASA